MVNVLTLRCQVVKLSDSNSYQSQICVNSFVLPLLSSLTDITIAIVIGIAIFIDIIYIFIVILIFIIIGIVIGIAIAIALVITIGIAIAIAIAIDIAVDWWHYWAPEVRPKPGSIVRLVSHLRSKGKSSFVLDHLQNG